MRKLSHGEGRLCPGSTSEALMLSRTQPLGRLPVTGPTVSQTGLIIGIKWGTGHRFRPLGPRPTEADFKGEA